MSPALKLRFYDMEPETSSLYDDVMNGLSLAQKSIPPKHFYDESGSILFDAICETDEYYPTRTEMSILEQNLKEITTLLQNDCVLIEPGSGSSQKVRVLLDSFEPHTYMPLDISSDYLQNIAYGLAKEYPNLHVTAACVDFTSPLELPYYPENKRRVVFFPGSSIGNFEPKKAINFLVNMASLAQKKGGLLIGVDLKKEQAILNAAYNDSKGVTAAFNLNVLQHINQRLEANFDLNAFKHNAFYNPKLGRVEMHLISKQDQQILISDQHFTLKQGESIHTENSYKYTIDEFQFLAKQAGFTPIKVWTDPQQLFSIHYMTFG